MTTTTWLPNKFASVGMVVKIKVDDVWDDGWTVDMIHSSLPENLLPDPHAAIKAHRRNTGDSMKKEQK